MAISQNDYVTLTQNHLNNYCLYKQFITNRDKDLADLYGQLDDVSVAISKYGNEPPGGGGGSPVVEREAEMRGRWCGAVTSYPRYQVDRRKLYKEKLWSN